MTFNFRKVALLTAVLSVMFLMSGCSAEPRPQWKHIGINDNQLKNPSFELVNYYNLPHFWKINNVQSYDKVAKDGKYCVRGHSYISTNTGIINQSFILSKRGLNPIDIQKGVYSIRFGGYQRGSGKTDETGKIVISFFDKNHRFISQVAANNQTLSNNWNKVDETVVIPKNAFKAQFNFVISKKNGSFEGPYLDDVFMYIVKNTKQKIVEKKSTVNYSKTTMRSAIGTRSLVAIQYKIEHGYNISNGVVDDQKYFKSHQQDFKAYQTIKPQYTVIAYTLQGKEMGFRSKENKKKTMAILKYFVEQGAQINVRQGKDVFCYGLSTGDYDVIKFLVENGADVNAYTYHYGLALSYARDIKTVKYLLEHGANINKQEKRGGYTPLMKQIYYNRYDIVKYLLDHAADVNIHSDTASALSTAVIRARSSKEAMELTKLLLKHGADVNLLKERPEYSAIANAANRGYLEVVKLLLKHGAAKTDYKHIQSITLRSAVVGNQLEVVSFLFDKKFQPYYDAKKKTGLNLLFQRARTEEMKHLLAKYGITK